MAELLIVLMMTFNLWMVIYLTWERREGNKTEDDKEKDCRMKEIPDDIMGKDQFRIIERKPRATTTEPNVATVVQSEAMDEGDVTFAGETDTDGGQAPENKASHQMSDGKLDETFSGSHVSDMAEYDGDEGYDDTPREVSGVTFEDIDLAMWTAKKPKAIGEGRRHAGMVFCDMKGNELFTLIERNSDAARRKLNELIGCYLDSMSATQAEPAPAAIPKKTSAVPDNFEDFNIHNFV